MARSYRSARQVLSPGFFTPSILSRVKLPVGNDVDQEDAHSTVLAPDVPVHVRDLFRAHLAVRTLEPRHLTASVPHVPAQVRFPGEPARTVRTAEFLRVVPPAAVAAVG